MCVLQTVVWVFTDSSVCFTDSGVCFTDNGLCFTDSGLCFTYSDDVCMSIGLDVPEDVDSISRQYYAG